MKVGVERDWLCISGLENRKGGSKGHYFFIKLFDFQKFASGF